MDAAEIYEPLAGRVPSFIKLTNSLHNWIAHSAIQTGLFSQKKPCSRGETACYCIQHRAIPLHQGALGWQLGVSFTPGCLVLTHSCSKRVVQVEVRLVPPSWKSGHRHKADTACLPFTAVTPGFISSRHNTHRLWLCLEILKDRDKCHQVSSDHAGWLTVTDNELLMSVSRRVKWLVIYKRAHGRDKALPWY